MKISDAIQILNITNYTVDTINKISYNELKKHYHIQSLIYHPDKNVNLTITNNTLLFQEIANAYHFLKELLFNRENSDNTYNDNNDNNDNNDYKMLLMNFVNFIIKYYTKNEKEKEKYEDIDLGLDNLYQMRTILLNLLDNFSITIIEDLYLFLLKYKTDDNNDNDDAVPLLSNNIITIIKKILQEKLSNYNIYILTPNMNNLLNNDVYKLDISNDLLYIPLWHNELKFENNIIKIDPFLEEHIQIDIDNNIHYKYYNTFDNLVELVNNNNNSITIAIENQIFTININKLTFSKYQIYTIKNKGLPKVNISNILDNSIKSDIIFHIYLT